MNSNNHDQDQSSVRPKIITVKPNFKDHKIKQVQYSAIEDQKIAIPIEDGSKQIVSALHNLFVHHFDHFNYPPYPFHGTEKQFKEWFATITEFDSNLEILLKLPHHAFWSTVIYDKKINLGLRNYISFTNRFYKINKIGEDGNVLIVMNSIHERVFKAILRLSTAKESEKHFWNQTNLGKILYDHKLFDIIYLMDITATYGHINDMVDIELIKLINFVIESNSNFEDQIEASVEIKSMQLSQLAQDLGLLDEEDSLPKFDQLNKLDWSIILKFLEQVADTTVPMSFFIGFNPIAAELYRKHCFELQIIKFYDKLPDLKVQLEERFVKQTNEDSEQVKNLVNIIRSSLINAYRFIVRAACLEKLFEPRIDFNKKSLLIDEYFDLCLLATSSRCFSNDYFSKFSAECDIFQLLDKAEVTNFESVDPSRTDYLLNVIEGNGTNIVKKDELMSTKDSKESSSSITHLDSNSTTSNTDKVEPNEQAKLSLHISSVKDIFPQLDEVYIEKCLRYYNYDPEKVIDAILVNNLPECLKMS